MKRALLIATLVLAGFASQASAQIDVKRFAPALTDCSGIWHRSPVSIEWTVVPPFVADLGCDNETLDHDTTGTVRGCSAETPQGDTVSRGVTVKLDMTAPIVTGATASRETDANGWYRSPVQVAFSGTDATSGLDGCTSATYGGPTAPPRPSRARAATRPAMSARRARSACASTQRRRRSRA